MVNQAEIYRERLARAYNHKVKPRTFTVKDLVLAISPYLLRNCSSRKFAPDWEGPYRVIQVADSGYYKIEHLDGSPIKRKANDKVNGECIKAFNI